MARTLLDSFCPLQMWSQILRILIFHPLYSNRSRSDERALYLRPDRRLADEAIVLGTRASLCPILRRVRISQLDGTGLSSLQFSFISRLFAKARYEWAVARSGYMNRSIPSRFRKGNQRTQRNQSKESKAVVGGIFFFGCEVPWRSRRTP